MDTLKSQQLARRLTKRDVEILTFFGEHGFSTAKWLCEKFWSGKNIHHVYRRMRMLKGLKLIEPIYNDSNRPLGYRLAKKGLSLLRKATLPSDSKEHRAAFDSNFKHDEALIGISLVMKSLRGVSQYEVENVVRKKLVQRYGKYESKREGFKVPDALFVLQTKNSSVRVALELERVTKSAAYRARTLRRLIISDDFDLVFIIVSNAKSLKLYHNTVRELREKDVYIKVSHKDNGVYFATLEDLMRDRENCTFTGEGKSFRLCELSK